MSAYKLKEPDLLKHPFAIKGDKNILTDTSNESEGFANLSQGFPASTELPKQLDGKLPQRMDFNGINFMLSSFFYWLQSGGQWTYKGNLRYAPNCMVLHDNKYYVCIKENGVDTIVGVKQPGTVDGSGFWQLYSTAIGAVTKEEIENNIASKTTVIEKSITLSQVMVGTGAFSFKSNVTANRLAIYAVVDVDPYGSTRKWFGWSSSSNVTVAVNGIVLGTLNMYAYSHNDGDRGFYWGYIRSVPNAATYNYKIKPGDMISITNEQGARARPASVKISLGN